MGNPAIGVNNGRTVPYSSSDPMAPKTHPEQCTETGPGKGAGGRTGRAGNGRPGASRRLLKERESITTQRADQPPGRAAVRRQGPTAMQFGPAHGVGHSHSSASSARREVHGGRPGASPCAASRPTPRRMRRPGRAPTGVWGALVSRPLVPGPPLPARPVRPPAPFPGPVSAHCSGWVFGAI